VSIEWPLAAVVASRLISLPAAAQTCTPSLVTTTADSAFTQSNEPATKEPRAATRFLRDVGGDYKHFFSKETAAWLALGGGSALAMHPADEALRDATQDPGGPSTSLKGGREYGGAFVQVPLALGWWIIGSAAGSERGAAAGRDLLRAQISAVSWTSALKYPINRTRPDGDSWSFPSGHASATFATAMVLEEHYGWKIGMPAFAAATYTATSRVTDNKHWASDVVFGAFLGIASGRTVTVRLRGKHVALAPAVVPGGGMVLVSVSK
jgi:hypothetical protein